MYIHTYVIMASLLIVIFIIKLNLNTIRNYRILSRAILYSRGKRVNDRAAKFRNYAWQVCAHLPFQFHKLRMSATLQRYLVSCKYLPQIHAPTQNTQWIVQYFNPNVCVCVYFLCRIYIYPQYKSLNGQEIYIYKQQLYFSIGFCFLAFYFCLANFRFNVQCLSNSNLE